MVVTNDYAKKLAQKCFVVSSYIYFKVYSLINRLGSIDCLSTT